MRNLISPVGPDLFAEVSRSENLGQTPAGEHAGTVLLAGRQNSRMQSARAEIGPYRVSFFGALFALALIFALSACSTSTAPEKSATKPLVAKPVPAAPAPAVSNVPPPAPRDPPGLRRSKKLSLRPDVVARGGQTRPADPTGAAGFAGGVGQPRLIGGTFRDDEAGQF